MPDISPELRAAIEVAKQRIEVDSYFPYAMNKGLKGNAQGVWAGTVLGGFTGALAGGLISAGFILAGIAAPYVGLPMILAFTGLGTVMGSTIGSRIGSSAGSVAGVMAERERRDRGIKLEQEILASPEKQREVIAAYHKDPVVEKDNTIGELAATHRDPQKALLKFVDPRTFTISLGLCTLAGMLIFSGAYAVGLGAGIPWLAATTLPAVLMIGGGVGAAFGAAFGVSYPMIFASLTKGVGDLLGNKLVNGTSTFARIKGHDELIAESIENEGTTRFRSIATLKGDKPLSSIANVVEHDLLIPVSQRNVAL